MKKYHFLGMILSGLCAGAINGLFGAGGGMVLVPLLSFLTPLEEHEIFASSIAIILPICFISIGINAITGNLAWREALPYLLGSAVGGYAAGIWGQKIPVQWLHRSLGILIIWGGLQYLC